ncbi:MAG TPA: hypothetical protein VFJ97_03425 [Dermatophilaceae bacterium]|nr:hypothetical protein [Dermatophilaceae bacterium]
MASLSDREYRRAFYRAVDPFQAAKPTSREYYEPIYDRPALADQDVTVGLRDGIEFTAGTSVHFLSGFRGCGKTSELLRLKEDMARSGYRVVYVDVDDYFNTELPLDMGGFAFGLAAGFADGCEQIPGGAAAKEPPRERFTRLLKRLQIEPSYGYGGAEIKASLRDDDSFRKKLNDAMRSNRKTFRQELHTFFRDTASTVRTDRGTVYIVDSIDHFRGRAERFDEVRQSVEAVFIELADDLILPGINTIYTVPIYVQPEPLGVRHDVLNIKVTNRDGSPNADGRDALRAVLTKRAPDHDLERLVEGPTLERLVEVSGGLIRDLLRLAQELLLVPGSLPADGAALTRAEFVIRRNMESTLSQEQVDLLRKVASTRDLKPENDQWADAMALMSGGAILLYPNGERAWYDVHPLLKSLLG